MKKFIALTSLAFLLTGCSQFIEGVKEGVNEAAEAQDSEQKINDLKEQLKKEIQVEPVSLQETEYNKYITGKIDTLKKNQEVILDVFNNSSTIEDPMLKMGNAAIENMKISKEIQTATVPEKYKETHQYFVDATNSYLVYLEKLKEGLLVNEVDVSSVLDKYEEMNDFLMKGLTMLNDLDPEVVGDGTITTEDLDELDSLAGIDHDSVTLNVSKDGKELIGKWLYDDKSVALVLNADGSYEGYGRGLYPSKDNVMLGTWEYDFRTHQLIIENKEVYKDGKSVSAGNRAKQEMVLTYFKDDILRMMDAQTLAEFSFEKQKEQKE